jgi:exodeoxyribonuclease V gamma subunit
LFELDKIQKWNLKCQLLSHDESGISLLKTKLLKNALLPLKNMAEIAIQEIKEEIEPLKILYQQCVLGQSPTTLDIDYDFNGVQISGILHNVYETKIVVVSFSKNDIKYMLEAAINYVVALMQFENISIHFISSHRQKIYTGAILTKNESTEILSEYLNLYIRGQESMLLYNPAFDIDPQKIEHLDEMSLKKILNGIIDTQRKDFADPYLVSELNKGLFSHENCVAILQENCRTILNPLLKIFPDYFNS